jgi:hypothetical protein
LTYSNRKRSFGFFSVNGVVENIAVQAVKQVLALRGQFFGDALQILAPLGRLLSRELRGRFPGNGDGAER